MILKATVTDTPALSSRAVVWLTAFCYFEKPHTKVMTAKCRLKMTHAGH